MFEGTATGYLLIVVLATSISLALTPLMVKAAPWLGMLDHPDVRKVHVQPIARVGGWGIVFGTLCPIFLLLPLNPLLQSYVTGVIVLFIFGSLDDRWELGHYTKFIGQVIAVLPMLLYGDLYVKSLPFLGFASLSPIVGILFTLVAMVGVINALNHSDGLDGLAGGESILSLLAISFLAYQVDAIIGIAISMATIGGVLGFLRYNTHPAQVFMGDGGSQFLGFTLGFLGILLTQELNPTLSPAIVALIFGLPIADILMVLKNRALRGSHWFLATKDHVHHRLLDLGFVHHESVVIIYSVQILLVASSILLSHENDWLIITVFLVVIGAVFSALRWAEKSGWQPGERSFNNSLSIARQKILVIAPRRYLDITTPLYLIIVSLLSSEVPKDFGILAGIVLFGLLAERYFAQKTRAISGRIPIYLAIALVVFLNFEYPRTLSPLVLSLIFSFMFLAALSVAAAVRFSPGRRKYEFEATAMDYLMVVLVISIFLYSIVFSKGSAVSLLIIQLVILLYVSELMIIEKREKWNPMALASLVSVAIIAVRGIF